MIIRAACAQDCGALSDIWNPIIRETSLTFNPVEKSRQDIETLLKDKAKSGDPFLVAEQDGLLGFATYGQFRGGLGYRFTVEHTIILAPEARGTGIGRQLMEAIEDHARERGMHSMIAGVSSANPGGVHFHARLGYRTIAVLPEVGFKFDRWLDLTLMQKILTPG